MHKRIFVFLSFLSAVSTAWSVITINVSDSGPNLVMETTGGTLNLTDLVKSTSTILSAGLNSSSPSLGSIRAGGSAGGFSFVDRYDSTFTVSGDSFSKSDSVSGADSVSSPGPFFGLSENLSVVYVPNGYNSGDTISGSSITFNNKNLSDFGFPVGSSRTWEWGSGANADSITLTAVPEPSQYALIFGVAMLVFCISRRRFFNRTSA